MKHRTLSAAIAERLRQEILGGVHASGAQLRQDALAAAYQVSRIPVREALFQLEAEGLVRIEPHKGAVVTSLSLSEINDVFDLRMMLEPRLLRASVPVLTAAQFETIERLQALFCAAIRSRDNRTWGTLNAELHGALYAGADLPRTSAIVASLLQTSDRYTRMQMNSAASVKRAEKEHDDLIRLAKKRDVDAAAVLLRRHIEGVYKDLLRVLRERSADTA